jgi:hypothetical protein
MIAQAFIAGVTIGALLGFLIGVYMGYSAAVKDQRKMYKDHK